MDYAPNPTRSGAHIALLEVPLNHLKNKGPAADEVAQEETSGKVSRQVGMVAGFYLDSNLKCC